MDNLLTHAQLIEKINAFLEKYQSDLSYSLLGFNTPPLAANAIVE
jgi:hypothetical protein